VSRWAAPARIYSWLTFESSGPTLVPAAVSAPRRVAPSGTARRAAALLAAYAGVRLALLLADMVAAHRSYLGDLGGPLRSWDSHFYLDLAAHGYPGVALSAHGHLTYGSPAFEPLFPLLIRLAALSGLSYLGAGLVVSLLGGALATLLVWRLGAAVVDEAVGWRAGLLFVVFPGVGLGWGLVYSECVGLALAAGCLLLMVRERWVWAGLVGALATATSPIALALALPPLWLAVRARRTHRPPRPLVAAGLVPAGFVLYAAWIGYRYHDALFLWHLQKQAWGTSLDFGRANLAMLGRVTSLGSRPVSWYEVLSWAGALLVVGAVVALFRARLPALVNVYCAGVFFLLFVVNNLGFRPRLLSWAFPALIAVAALLRGRVYRTVVLVSALVLPLVFIVYTTLGNSTAQP